MGDVVGGVKSTIVKAKTTAVKAGKRKLNKAEKEEVDDLLEMSRNEAATNGNGTVETPTVKVAATSSKIAVAAIHKKMEKIKSVVSVAANRNGNFEQLDTTPTRRSKRISQRAGVVLNGDHVNGATNGEATNGAEPMAQDISVAEEATEPASTAVNGAGLLKKTISKIWKLPQDIANGFHIKRSMVQTVLMSLMMWMDQANPPVLFRSVKIHYLVLIINDITTY